MLGEKWFEDIDKIINFLISKLPKKGMDLFAVIDFVFKLVRYEMEKQKLTEK